MDGSQVLTSVAMPIPETLPSGPMRLIRRLYDANTEGAPRILTESGEESFCSFTSRLQRVMPAGDNSPDLSLVFEHMGPVLLVAPMESDQLHTHSCGNWIPGRLTLEQDRIDIQCLTSSLSSQPTNYFGNPRFRWQWYTCVGLRSGRNVLGRRDQRRQLDCAPVGAAHRAGSDDLPCLAAGFG